jgi:hypothetical protein
MGADQVRGSSQPIQPDASLLIVAGGRFFDRILDGLATLSFRTALAVRNLQFAKNADSSDLKVLGMTTERVNAFRQFSVLISNRPWVHQRYFWLFLAYSQR